MSEPAYLLLPVHNRRDLTIRLVRSLNAQTQPNFRLVLIDDGSGDGTAEAVRALRPETIVIEGNGHWWWAGCLDQACRWLARQGVPPATVVGIMNDDVEIEPDFVGQAVAELAENPGTLLLARQRDATTRRDINGGGGVRVDWGRLAFKAEPNPTAINCLPTRGLFLRWGDLQRAGGFRPWLLPHYLSDYEFTFRAHRRGLRLRVAENAALFAEAKHTGWLRADLFAQPRGRRWRMVFSRRYKEDPRALATFVGLAAPAWRWPWLGLKMGANFAMLLGRCLLTPVSPAKSSGAVAPGPDRSAGPLPRPSASGAAGSALTTPVVFIVFNRPDCTRQSLAALRAARPQRLYVVADGPRADRAGEAALCAEVRALVEQGVDWPCEVIRDYTPANLGCARRVVSGLNAVFALESEAIILEDDCVPDATFFPFCAELLARYRQEPQVGLVAGDNFQGRAMAGHESYYFSRYPHCWGWATWRRAWQTYDHGMEGWPEAKRTGWLRTRFETRGEAEYWERIFDRVYSGEVDSWAYRWTFACWWQDFLTVLPAVNLVENIGFGETATHTRRDHPGGLPATQALSWPLRHRMRIERLAEADRRTYFSYFNPPRWLRLWRRF